MSEIAISREDMRKLLKGPESQAEKVLQQLDGFSQSADLGKATDEISVIVRIAMESAEKAAIASQAVCQIAREAVDDLAATEQSVLESLDNFSEAEFG